MKSPMIRSEWPAVYPLAVSMKFPPRSKKRAMMVSASCTDEPQPHSSPNVIAPRQKRLTRNPELPSVT